MRNLRIFINIELGGGYFFFLEETGNTVLPGLEAVKTRGVVQCFAGMAISIPTATPPTSASIPSMPNSFLKIPVR